MTQPKDLKDTDIDAVTGAMSSDPEWRYVPVRRFAASTKPGAYTLPEVDDEVLVGSAQGEKS